MARSEEVELTNMCMVCDGKGNVLVQHTTKYADWRGWCFPGGHVERDEYVTPSVIREIREETGLTIENPRLCGIKEFHRGDNGMRYIVFLYATDRFSGELKSSDEGEVFWYPLTALLKSDQLIDWFRDSLPVFTDAGISEMVYAGAAEDLQPVYW